MEHRVGWARAPIIAQYLLGGLRLEQKMCVWCVWGGGGGFGDSMIVQILFVAAKGHPQLGGYLPTAIQKTLQFVVHMHGYAACTRRCLLTLK